jgi:hypothetical protein
MLPQFTDSSCCWYWHICNKNMALLVHLLHNETRSQWSRGLQCVGLRPLALWDCGFESRRRHGCLYVMIQQSTWVVRYSYLRRADHSYRGLLQSVVCLCYTSKPQQWGCLGQLKEYSHGKKKHVMKHDSNNNFIELSRLLLKCDNTRWRTGGKLKGKQANGVGSQYSSHYLETWCIQHYYRWRAHLGYQ